ncbi:uncharacterized protein [Epargyreus clarus]|uniref:uncharacterized protein isoform X2 n=1 Tax=Epargyreus clarus TaxID=520877 RepID=UPI003C2FFA5A
MPYYCTVPRCTSMAGKVKNVSFHQFPRDEELAKLWNKILKRGKPYTKYSKVCSLHFTPDDYTITNAGQWRTLRKDAIPSRNLPTEAPTPYHRRVFTPWSPSNAVDPRLHQQMAQAIYVQTMLAMQAAGVTDVNTNLFNNDQQMPSPNTDSSRSPTSNQSDQMSLNYDQIENILQQRNLPIDPSTDIDDKQTDRQTDVDSISSFGLENKVTYRCNECSKCFKDPDVFVLHKRVHTKNVKTIEKENIVEHDTQETLKANPILANLLKSSIPQGSISDLDGNKAFDTNVNSIESQIMTALAANMENYLRNLSTIMTSNFIDNRIDANDNDNDDRDTKVDDGPNIVDKNDCDKQDYDTHDNLVIDEGNDDDDDDNL